ncbi:unnamed protein product, partial [Durusdinium trenchii]
DGGKHTPAAAQNGGSDGLANPQHLEPPAPTAQAEAEQRDAAEAPAQQAQPTSVQDDSLPKQPVLAPHAEEHEDILAAQNGGSDGLAGPEHLEPPAPTAPAEAEQRDAAEAPAQQAQPTSEPVQDAGLPKQP